MQCLKRNYCNIFQYFKHCDSFTHDYPLKLASNVHNRVQITLRHYTPRRALLYVPGDDKRKLDKTLGLDVDCVAMDCEDGVALNRKNAARKTIREILDKGKPENIKYDWAIRLNSVDSGLCQDDVNELLTAKNLPDTVLLPKVENINHLKSFAEQINNLVKPEKRFNLIIYIESAIAMLHLVDICKSAAEISSASRFVPAALVFGSDDFCASIGATRTEDSSEILYARQKLVLTAKAFNLQAIDMVYIKYKDLEGLKRQSEQGARMGYTGKQVIHPSQIPVVQDAFLPSSRQIEWASGLLKAFEEHQKSGKGAFTYMGSMIDMPTMKQAQNIIDTVTYANKKGVNKS